MRIVAMTVVAIAWLMTPAHAQSPTMMAPPGSTLPGMGKPPKEEEHPPVKADEKAYKSALDAIQAKKTHDPWATVREKPQSNTSR